MLGIKVKKQNGSMVKKYLIIGAGKLGTSLYRLLSETFPGHVLLYGRREPMRFKSSYLIDEDYTNYLAPELIANIDVVFLTVPDDSIREAARIIHLYPLTGKKVFHTSGARDSSELEILKLRGASIGSLHPMQSFAKKFSSPVMWQNIVCSFEGDDTCYVIAEKLCEKITARLMRVSPEQKTAIHIAGVITANFTIGLLNFAENLLISAGLTDFPKNEILFPLLEGVLTNYKKAPSDEILTGPIKRGDMNVLREHINYLQEHKIDTSIYYQLSRMLLDNPNFGIKNHERLKTLFEKFK